MKDFAKTVHQNRLVVVLGCLILTMCVHPIAEEWPNGQVIFYLSFAVVLFASLFAVSRTHCTFIMAFLLGAPPFAIFWFGILVRPELFDNRQYNFIIFLFMSMFMILIGSHILFTYCKGDGSALISLPEPSVFIY